MRKIFLSLSIMLLAAGCTSVSNAQADYPPDPATLKAVINDQHKLRLALELGHNGGTDWLAGRLAKDKFSDFAKNNVSQIAESASQSLQNGSNVLSSAATSLVAKSMSSILGAAEETGAVSSTTSGTSTTLTVNVQQFVNALGMNGRQCYILSPDCSFGSQLVRGASVAVSISPAAQSNGLSSIENSALAGLTGVQTPVFNNLAYQENFHGRKKPNISQSEFTSKIANIDPGVRSALATKLSDVQTMTLNNSSYDNALTNCVERLQLTGGDIDKIKAEEDLCIENLYNAVKVSSQLDVNVQAYMQAQSSYSALRNTALNALYFPSTWSLEYDLTNNAKQPLLSSFKFIYGYMHNSGGQLQITANGSATLYNTLESSSESRLRSAQGAVQFDYKPNSTQKLQTEWSSGYYFQYMVANGLINLPSTALAPGTSIPLPSGASTLLNTTGPIHIGQGKLTLSIKGTNIKIPLAITGASRTDLIKANRVSGNFGISYDFSSLFASK